MQLLSARPDKHAKKLDVSVRYVGPTIILQLLSSIDLEQKQHTQQRGLQADSSMLLIVQGQFQLTRMIEGIHLRGQSTSSLGC